MSNKKTLLVGVRLSEDLVLDMDISVREGRYKDRSDLIRTAVIERIFIDKHPDLAKAHLEKIGDLEGA